MKTDCRVFLHRCLYHFFATIMAVVFAGPTYSMEKNPDKSFRRYDDAPADVKQFYKDQHAKQTVDFVRKQRKELDALIIRILFHDDSAIATLLQQKKLVPMSIWEALMMLDTLQDQSDPDFTLPNSIHALQTAEAIRRDLPKIAAHFDKKEEDLSWLILVGLLHDIGKVDALLRKVPQWAVVGDSFPVGCRFSEENIFYEFFAENPDNMNPYYNTEIGIYSQNIGIEKLLLSFGHDEYAYQVLESQGQLPRLANFIIRFHSFYPFHCKNVYQHFQSETDKKNLPWSKLFSTYDLYSKSDHVINVDDIRPFYRELINKYFPPTEEETRAAPSLELAEHKLLWPVLNDIQ